MDDIIVEDGDLQDQDVVDLLDELSDYLEGITGDSGRNSFSLSDMNNPKSVFAVARNTAGEAIGCGCIRPIDDNVAELKRMFSKYKSGGIGRTILKYLELRAIELGFNEIWLETRAINDGAVRFYESNGYSRIDNFGKYKGNDKAVCFSRKLLENVEHL